MKCSNCGTDNYDNAQACARCGMPFGPPQGYQQPQGQYQQPPPQYQQQQYQAPPQAGYQQPMPQYQQPVPQPVPRVPTVKNVHIGDLFLIIAGMLAFGAGIENFSAVAFNAPIQYVILGLVGMIIGILVLIIAVMPNAMKALSGAMGILCLVLGLVLLIWGFAACFGRNIGLDGGFFAASGLSLIFAGLLRMGMLK